MTLDDIPGILREHFARKRRCRTDLSSLPDEDVYLLIAKRLENTATPEELERLSRLCRENPSYAALLDSVQKETKPPLRYALFHSRVPWYTVLACAAALVLMLSLQQHKSPSRPSGVALRGAAGAGARREAYAALQRKPVVIPAIEIASGTHRSTNIQIYSSACALLIGIDAYGETKCGLDTLDRAVDDVNRVAAALGQFQYNVMIKLTNEFATRAAIISNISSLAQAAGPDGSLLVYFAGHGLDDSSANVGYWIPYGGVTNAADLSAGNISTHLLTNLVQSARVKHAYLIADCCFAGNLAAGTTRGSAGRAPDFFYLRATAGKKAMQILASSLKHEKSVDGAFAGELVKALATETDKPYLTAAQVENYVMQEVPRVVRGMQTGVQRITQRPVRSRLLNSRGEYIFARRSAPPLEYHEPQVATSIVAHIPGVKDHTKMIPLDIDDDGMLELITLSNQYVQVFGLDGTLHARRAFVESTDLSASLLADVTDDGRPELFVPWCDARNLHISQLDYQLQPLRVFTYPVKKVSRHIDDNEQVFWETNGMCALCAGKIISNLIGDDRKELVASVFTGYGEKPREVFCTDLASGKTHWRWPYAPGLMTVSFMRHPHTGRNLLLFGSGACGNGATQGDGTSDMHSYVFAVDAAAGTTIWRHVGGSLYSSTRILPVDCNRDGVDEILAYVEADSINRAKVGLPTYGAALLFDMDGRMLAQREFPGSVTHAVPMADYLIDRDVLLLAVRGQGLQVFDGDLRPLGITAFTNATASPINLTVIGMMDTRFGEYLAVYACEVSNIVSSVGQIDGIQNVVDTRNMRIALLEPRTLAIRHEIPLQRHYRGGHPPQVHVTIRDMDNDGSDDLLVQMPDHVAVYTLAPADDGTE